MCTPKGKTHSREAESGGFQNERENSKADCRNEEPDHRGRGRDEQHHPPEGSEGCRRLLRHRQIREHCRPQRLQHLVGLGCGWARVEIPEGRFHRGAGRAEMRIGHPDPDLRRHRNPAGALQTAQTRRRQERRLQRMRRPHPHRGAGTHAAEPAQPCQHHGKP